MSELIVKKIITQFFKNKFSKETELKFRYWFKESKDEVETAIQELWDESPSQITEQTWQDLAVLKSELGLNEPAKRINNPIFKVIVRYAAILALIITTSLITYLITQPEEISYAECSVPLGKKQTITLSDGSIVSINAGSTLIFPKEFTTKTRTVFLSGEAIFSVAKNPHKPFIVKTNHLSVKALGTKFDVKAYSDLENTTTTLIEGKIRVNNNYSQDEYDLVPNQQIVFNNKNHKIAINDVDASKVGLWEDGFLIFQNVSFAEIISTLERKYDVQVSYNKEQYKDIHCNVKFSPNETISDVMSVLCAITKKEKFEIHNNQVLILSKIKY